MIYLASPYSHPDPQIRELRFLAACRYAASLIEQGYLVFSPIAHSHPIATAGDLDLGFEAWKRLDLRMIAVCSELCVLELPGWTESVGVKNEIEFAQQLGIRVTFADPNEIPV